MKIAKSMIGLLSVLTVTPASAAVLEFQFSGIFDKANAFAPAGSSFSGKFGYETEIIPGVQEVNHDGPSGATSLAMYDDPSIFLEVAFAGRSYRSVATAYVQNSLEYGHMLRLMTDVGDGYVGISFKDPSSYDLGYQWLSWSLPTLGAGNGASGEFDFYEKNTGNFEMTSISSVSPAKGPIASAVPEPATWAMMVFGFGAVGATIRKSREGKPVRATA